MINEKATLRWMGYSSDELSFGSHKKVWAVCDDCGKGRWIEYRRYKDLCRHCATTSESFIRKNSESHKGKKNHRYGISMPEKIRKQISATLQGVRIEKWTSFTTSESQKFYNSNKYDAWRQFVFKRDKFTCQECGDSPSGKLNAHHILPYRDWKDTQYSLNPMNGITLCKTCHEETYGNEYEFFNKYFDIVNGVGKSCII